MYDIVAAVRDGRAAMLVRLVDARGMSSRWPGAVAAVSTGTDRAATPGGLVAGQVVAGALDDRLAGLALGRHEVRVSDVAAAGVGLSCGGQATLFVQPATDLPEAAWLRFETGRPVTLVTDLDGPTPGATVIRDDSRVAETGTRVIEEDGVVRLIAAYRPAMRLVIVGEGLLAEALAAQSALLGWTAEVSADPAVAVSLGPSDGVIVLSHDDAIDVPFLAAALPGAVGYVGALGSRRTQDRRAAGLRAVGVTDTELARIHGPAGLDIGSSTPTEIALAVVAEFLATVRGGSAVPLSERGGPVHR
jgi:xanthine dehydrogenase accessory factor